MEIRLLEPRGFCAGVERAIRIVDLALDVYGPPVYVRKEIVHNRRVVEHLRARGVVFVDEIDGVPAGSLVIMSAHGVGPQVIRRSRSLGHRVIDATCPLVAKVHLEVRRYVKHGYSVILIGHRGHDEVVATMSEAPESVFLVANPREARTLRLPRPAPLIVLTQTTLSVDDAREIMAILRERFPALETPAKDDICYATSNRQEAVKHVLPAIELLLVVGSVNSSNATRLVEVARSRGVRAQLIDGAADIRPEWLQGVRAVGLTAGASTPEDSVREVIGHLQRQFGAGSVIREQTAFEDIVFPLPPALAVHDTAGRQHAPHAGSGPLREPTPS